MKFISINFNRKMNEGHLFLVFVYCCNSKHASFRLRVKKIRDDGWWLSRFLPVIFYWLSFYLFISIFVAIFICVKTKQSSPSFSSY